MKPDRELSDLGQTMIQLGLRMMREAIEIAATGGPVAIPVSEYVVSIKIGLSASEEMLNMRPATLPYTGPVDLSIYRHLSDAANLVTMIESCVLVQSVSEATSEDRERAKKELDSLLLFVLALENHTPTISPRTLALGEFAHWGNRRVLGAHWESS